jgi:hypothetical protein
MMYVDIMLASLVYEMDIIVWQHCSNNPGLDSDPDPTCTAIYRPTYPHRYNSQQHNRYRCEINIIQYPQHSMNKLCKTLNADDHYESVSVVVNDINHNRPIRPEGYRRRFFKNSTYDPAKEREDNPAFERLLSQSMPDVLFGTIYLYLYGTKNPDTDVALGLLQAIVCTLWLYLYYP